MKSVDIYEGREDTPTPILPLPLSPLSGDEKLWLSLLIIKHNNKFSPLSLWSLTFALAILLIRLSEILSPPYFHFLFLCLKSCQELIKQMPV